MEFVLGMLVASFVWILIVAVTDAAAKEEGAKARSAEWMRFHEAEKAKWMAANDAAYQRGLDAGCNIGKQTILDKLEDLIDEEDETE